MGPLRHEPARAEPAAVCGNGAPAPHARAEDRLLGLQQSAGNAAVGGLMRWVAGMPFVDIAAGLAAGIPPRTRFEDTMRARFGVNRVRAGTEADQVAEMRRFTPPADPSPTAIPGWQAWDPDLLSDLYPDILAGFEATARALGGIPEVSEIRFLESDYDNVGGSAQRRQRHGAH